MPYYSPSTGGFYTAEVHGADIPSDAIKISGKKYAALMAAQETGAKIISGRRGPVAHHAQASREEQLATAIRSVRKEAKKRILAVASLERQSNDNAAIAAAALQEATGIGITIDLLPAIERRRAIDAIRAASNAIELELQTLPAKEIAAFQASSSLGWPQEEGAA